MPFLKTADFKSGIITAYVLYVWQMMTISDKTRALLFSIVAMGSDAYAIFNSDIPRKQEIYILLATRNDGENRVQRQFSDKSDYQFRIVPTGCLQSVL